MNDQQILESALQIASSDERKRFLREACAGDATRIRRIEAQIIQKQVEDYQNTQAAAADTGTPVESMETAPTALPPEVVAGARVGPYKLLQQIGEGGMGAVWMAEQEVPVRRLVALKAIKAGMDSRQVLARFEAERQALALMDHPNIAKVLDAGATTGGRPYFVMELVKGIPVTLYCDEHRLDIRQRLELFIPICNALQHAHQKGIIHRDLKPSNVLIAQYDGRPVPKVIDFGVAKATGSKLTERTMFTGFGTVIGTLEYMSPEQAEFNALDIDTRSDVYSLGVLLYELLTGSTPLGKDTLRQAAFDEVLRRIKEEDPPKPSTRVSNSMESLPSISAQRHAEPGKLTGMIRGDLDWIVMKALAKERDRRYESANSFAVDLMHYLSDEPVAARPPSRSYLFKKFVRRHRAGVAAAAIAILALIAATVVSSMMYRKAHIAQLAEVKQRELAVEARDAEVKQRKAAQAEKERAEQSERQTNAINRFYANHILMAPRPKGQDGGLGVDVPFIQVLTAAEKAAGDVFRGEPEIETSVRQVFGNTYSRLEMKDRAIEQFERALRLCEQAPGPDKVTKLRLLANLVGAIHLAGDLDRARKLADEVLMPACRGLEPTHPVSLQAKAQLAGMHRDAGRPDLAVPIYAELGPAFTKLMESSPDDVRYFSMAMITRSNEGEALLETGQADKGLAILREVLDRRIKHSRIGPQHVETFNSMIALGAGYLAAGKPTEAIDIIVKAQPVGAALKVLDMDYGVYGQEVLARAYLANKQFDEAERILRTLVARHGLTWGAYRTRSLLGVALAGQQKAEAEAELKAGYDGLKKYEGKISALKRERALADAADRLADYYAAAMKSAEAAQWRKTASSHRGP